MIGSTPGTAALLCMLAAGPPLGCGGLSPEDTRAMPEPVTQGPPASGSAGAGASLAGTSSGIGGGGGAFTATPAGTGGATAGSVAPGTAGSAGGGGASGVPAAGAGAPAGCAAAAANDQPFGCTFAFGTNDPGGSLAAFGHLQFMSKWVGYEVDQQGNLPRCDGCSWLSQQVASTALVPVYYAYFIGYFGHANGFADGNENPNGPNLTTDGAALIRDHRAQLVAMYASYAEQSARVWGAKPLVWLLEGDFVQYAGESQRDPLSYAELAGLALEITCAIKSAMPNAVVAINHSTWNPDQVTNDFWGAIRSAGVGYDLVWTTGVPNNDGFLEAGAGPSIYNHATATYAYLHELTGRKILVDTSFGLSAMSDTWSNAPAAVLNARIAEGVLAANVTEPPVDYAAAVTALGPQLDPTCD